MNVLTQQNEVLSDLGSRIVAGDLAAENEMVGRLIPALRVMVRRYRLSSDACDDIVQDILANVLGRLRRGGLVDSNSLLNYVRAAAVNAIAGYARSLQRAEHDVSRPSDDPAEIAERNELAQLARAVISELPIDRDRQILLRHYVKQESKEEICRRLGIEQNVFDRAISRARERVRNLVAASADEESL